MVKLLLQEMRLKQWFKNVVVFLPAIFADQMFGGETFVPLVLGFLAFSLTASSLYIFNDIIDQDKDRLHPEKKHRPIACGKLPVNLAITWALVILIISFIISFLINPDLIWILAIYAILIFTYSYQFKNIAILDMLTIALGFDLRVLAGAIIINVAASNWILVTTFFFALFLTAVKRRLEFRLLEQGAKNHRAVLEHYTEEFSSIILAVTATLALTSYSIYTLEESVVARMGTEALIYTVPFIFVFITRLIYLSVDSKFSQTTDPTNIILKDKAIVLATVSWIILILGITVMN